MKGKKVFMTGATGNLGRHVLCEILKEDRESQKANEVYVLGREKDGVSLKGRIEKIVEEEGVRSSSSSENWSSLLSGEAKMFCLPFDLGDEEEPRTTMSPWRELEDLQPDCFLHIAGVTGFRSDQETSDACRRVNINGLERLLHLVEKIRPRTFIFISSAYSSGRMSGTVSSECNYRDGVFANPYQRSKAKAENLLKEFSDRSGIPAFIIRPRTICGRLIDDPLGKTSKFDVFYAWAKVMLRFKAQLLNTRSWQNAIGTPVRVSLRMHMNPEAGLNIVPVDWCAKMIVQIMGQVPGHGAIHLTNPADSAHTMYVSCMLNSLNIDGVQFVNNEPEDKSPLEQMYYKTLGPIFGPYITGPSLQFVNNGNGVKLVPTIPCPRVDEHNFDVLMQFAVEKQFGLKDI